MSDGWDPSSFYELHDELGQTLTALKLRLQVAMRAEPRIAQAFLGRPLPLANALRRLDALAHRIPMDVAPAVAPLAQVNPLAAHGGVAGLFSTHPPTEERVARLEAMTVAASR